MAVTRISTATQLQNIIYDLSGDYVLDANISLAGYDWTYIGSTTTPFCGTFDGRNHTISSLHLTYNSATAYIGLFGKIAEATLENVVVRDFTFDLDVTNGLIEKVGALVGGCTTSAASIYNTINNCAAMNVDFNITNSSDGNEIKSVGGLLGYVEYTDIDDCYSTGDITVAYDASATATADMDWIGGMIGQVAKKSPIDDSHSEVILNLTGGLINASLFTSCGGFIGEYDSDDATMNNCYATGKITCAEGDADMVGGFAGFLEVENGKVTSCYATGNLVFNNCNNFSCIGGFAGDIDGDNNNAFEVKSCYATGNITLTGDSSTDAIGGFCANFWGDTLNSCYCTGDIDMTCDWIDMFGGFMGQTTPDITTSYITNCYCTGDIDIVADDIYDVGGFIGNMTFSGGQYMENCYATNDMTITINDGVSNGAEQIGGFVGEIITLSNTSYLKKCFSTVKITLANCLYTEGIGGFVGLVTMSTTGHIQDCYAQGDINLTVLAGADVNYIGGFVGHLTAYQASYIKNAYSSSNITVNSSSLDENDYVGGFCAGLNNGLTNASNFAFINCYSAGIIDLDNTMDFGGGFLGFAKIRTYQGSTLTLNNCSWYTGTYDYALGPYWHYSAFAVYTVNAAQALLATGGNGTDEADNDNFWVKTHDVYEQGADHAWDFTTPIWYERAYVEEYPTFEPVELPVSCGYAGQATSSISNLSHLEGQLVSILANGEVLDQQEVYKGKVDLGSSYSVAHVGLPFYSDLETLNVEVPMKEGTIQSRKVKIGNVTFRLHNSRGGYIGPDEDDLYEAFTQQAFRESSGQNIGDEELFTGDIRMPLGGQYSQGGRVFYRQSDPLPVTIGAIIPEVDVGGSSG